MRTAHSHAPDTPAPDTPDTPAPRRPAATLAVTAAATTLALMNYTAPMLTLPATAEAFGTPSSAQAWLLNGTPLGLAALLLVAGALADAHGRRRVFLLGTLALGVTTALGAFAGTTALFTAARIAQGAASAAILAGSLGLLADAYPSGRDRIRATGVWGASVSAGIALGPLLAAVLSLADWRLAYLALGAATLATAVTGARTLTPPRTGDGGGPASTPTGNGGDPAPSPGRTAGTPAPSPERTAGTPAPSPAGRAGGGGRPDLAGATTLALALGALLTALTLGRDGWLRPAVGVLLLASAVLLALFVAVERRRKDPMIDLGLLRRPAFRASTVGALFTGLAVIGLFSVLPSLLMRGQGVAPLAAAGLFVLWSGTSFVVALQARRLAGRISAPYQLALGFVLSAAGVLPLLGTVDAPAVPWPRLMAGLVVAGAGSGLLNAALPRLAVDSVPPERAAMGSGANNTARYIGSAAGVALMLALSATDPDTAFAASAALALAGAALTVAGSPRR
ncbi:MFS transporter [Streptomyces hydrogenans]|uniref:MFS transporter n=2 Tax=Streptomyces hydrogenans TaxID=1873719 RepID=A0ABQ3P711_9ACTN|nr:MFS transporter [Streptomyces hydrogenans]GHG02950.1 MFS transporter [Streptomyces hydrogenans]GHI20814.1 MFS transporter [Streptomyces hydrogenans]